MLGFDFRINERINVESTPPLRAIHNFFEFNDSSFSEISLQIRFSINLIFGGSFVVSKSFQVFLGKFGDIDGSYLRVRIFTIDEEFSNDLDDYLALIHDHSYKLKLTAQRLIKMCEMKD